MTISYNLDVSSSNLASFIKLLWRWRGSVWKSTYRELAVWLILYYLTSLTYRFLLTESQREWFEHLVAFSFSHSKFIPLTFMLGFFVNLVVTRCAALFVAYYIEGTDEKARMMRRNIIRYTVLVEAMVFRDVSPVVCARFPNDDALQASGFLTEEEKLAMRSVQSDHAKYWLPIHWAFNIMKEARRSGHVTSNRGVEQMQLQLHAFRTGLRRLRAYSWVPIPLVYTQVVFLAVRTYFLILLFGRQFVNGKAAPNAIDIYIPIPSILEFVFYLGWMKVAEALINPYGDDDDDFELNWFIDKNLQTGLAIVDSAVGKEPPLCKDIFWDDTLAYPGYPSETDIAKLRDIGLMPPTINVTKSSRQGNCRNRTRSYLNNENFDAVQKEQNKMFENSAFDGQLGEKIATEREKDSKTLTTLMGVDV